MDQSVVKDIGIFLICFLALTLYIAIDTGRFMALLSFGRKSFSSKELLVIKIPAIACVIGSAYLLIARYILPR